MPFSVMAESKSGQVHTLRSGFPTRAKAEDHPVKMSEWSRVWIEHVQPPPEPPRVTDDSGLPPLPWNWETSGSVSNNGSYHLYLIDATGRKIAAIWGRNDEKILTANRILDAVNATSTKDTP